MKKRTLDALLLALPFSALGLMQGGCLPAQQDTIAPQIVHVDVAPEKPEVNDTLIFTVDVADYDVPFDAFIVQATISNDSLNEPITTELRFHDKFYADDHYVHTFVLDNLPASSLGEGMYDLTFTAKDMNNSADTENADPWQTSLEIQASCEDAPTVSLSLEESYGISDDATVRASVTPGTDCTIDSTLLTFDSHELAMTDQGDGAYSATVDLLGLVTNGDIVMTESPQTIAVAVDGYTNDLVGRDEGTTTLIDDVKPTIDGSLNVTVTGNDGGNSDNLATTTTTITVTNLNDIGTGVASAYIDLAGSGYFRPMNFDGLDATLDITGDELTTPDTSITILVYDNAGNISDPLVSSLEVEDITGISLESITVDPVEVDNYFWNDGNDVSLTVNATDIQDGQDITVTCELNGEELSLAYISGTTYVTTFDPSVITPDVDTYALSCIAQDLDGYTSTKVTSFGVVDCDDTSLATDQYLDADGDGFGDLSLLVTSCETLSGYVADATDCDDSTSEIFPGADEYCNSIDNDCDGTADNDAVDTSIWYADTDADGYGDEFSTTSACDEPSGYVADATDCDDTQPGVNPGATEICDTYDTDCDGLTDDADDSLDTSSATTWNIDADSDGYGDSAYTTIACDVPSGYTSDDTDCDDAKSAVNPGESEICYDGLDNDCDGSASSCTTTGTIDLADLEIKLLGDAAGDGAGGAPEYSSVAAGGDLNGDGLDDVIVGATGYDSVGAAFVVYGTTSISGNLTDHPAVSGLAADDDAGYAVAGGDLTDDGSDDVVLGVPGEDGTYSQEGAVYVFEGPITGDLDLDDALAVVSGVDSNDYAGRALVLGDFNGDSIIDLVVGVPHGDEGGTSSGEVYLLNGPITADVDLDDADVTIGGDESGLYSGNALAAGDLDGDGLADLVIGVDHADSRYGATYVFWGPTTSGDLGDADVTLSGENSVDDSGRAVAVLPDIDGDGYDDLAVGAPYSDCLVSDGGAVYFVTGVSSDLTLSSGTVYGQTCGHTAGDYLGSHVASAGDVDGDGLGDAVLGAYEEDTGGSIAGAVYALYGITSGASDVSSAASTIYQGEDAGDRVGASAGFGDGNGDGNGDLVIAAPRDDDGGVDAGAVYLFFGDGY
jgi:hypothetical protein